MQDRLIFLIGAPRSGTTLLARMLGAQSQIYQRAEPHLITPIAHLGYYANVQKAPYDALNAEQAIKEIVADLPGGEADYLDALRAYTDTLYARLLALGPGDRLWRAGRCAEGPGRPDRRRTAHAAGHGVGGQVGGGDRGRRRAAPTRQPAHRRARSGGSGDARLPPGRDRGAARSGARRAGARQARGAHPLRARAEAPRHPPAEHPPEPARASAEARPLRARRGAARVDRAPAPRPSGRASLRAPRRSGRRRRGRKGRGTPSPCPRLDARLLARLRLLARGELPTDLDRRVPLIRRLVPNVQAATAVGVRQQVAPLAVTHDRGEEQLRH